MLSIIDRYLIRAITLPFVLGLVLTTFPLVLPRVLREAEMLVARGVDWDVILQIVLTLLPQTLSLTIPMALLLGILMGLAPLSADREFVALRACGVSLARLFRPVSVVAIVATSATAYQVIVALPDADRRFRQITFNLVAARIEQRIKPRVFFEDFPDHLIYVRDLLPNGRWRDVLLTDTSRPDHTVVYIAREGDLVIDRVARLVQLQLREGTSHRTSGSRPEAYESTAFDRLAINLNPEAVFPSRPPPKGPPERTFAELRAAINEAAAQGRPARSERFLFQYKLALPMTCPILALMALALGASTRKEGRLASFVLGVGVILLYYVLLYGARALALGGHLNADLAPWLPNVIMAAAAVSSMVRQSRSADRPVRLPWATRGISPRAVPAASPSPGRTGAAAVPKSTTSFGLPGPRILDRYVTREYLRVFALGLTALLGIFYVSTFVELSDKLFGGQATTSALLEYFVFQTPQFVHYAVPLAVLIATLVTIGTLTKNSELLVMRACGISLYRAAVPLLVLATLASGGLFVMQERVLATTNRRADRVNRLMRDWPPQATGMTRRWVVGQGGSLYHFDGFDPSTDRFSRLRLYDVDPRAWRLQAITYADEAVPAATGPTGVAPLWTARRGWHRDLLNGREVTDTLVPYVSFDSRAVTLDEPDYFKSDVADAELMNYTQLKAYIAKLQAGGSHVLPYVVALKRKLAFPLVTVVMTLIAIPFAVTTGRRGALYGIGIGIALALAYWIALSLCGALGAGGVLTPTLAAWAPNILFGAAALYGNLIVRT